MCLNTKTGKENTELTDRQHLQGHLLLQTLTYLCTDRLTDMQLYIVDNLYIFISDDPVKKEVLGHRRADWSKQLKILVEDIKVRDIPIEIIIGQSPKF